MVSLAGILEPFGKSQDLLRRLSGLRVGHETCRTLTETQGERLERDGAEAMPVEPDPDREPWDLSIPPADGASFAGTVAYAGMDAFAVPVLDGEGARDWRMMYVGLLYDPRKRHTIYLSGYDHRCLASQMRAYAIAFGLGSADQVVALTDGGNGLEAAFAGHFGGNVEFVLDFWHASEHLHGWAKMRYGEGSTEGAEWAAGAVERLRNEGGASVLAWLEGQSLPEGASEASVEEWRRLQGYVRNNVHRMDYPEYRRRGWDIGSGPTEAGCKIVGERLRGSGMKWDRGNSSRVARLRALYLSGEGLWDAFFDRRQARAA